MRVSAVAISIWVVVLLRLAQAQTDCGLPSADADRWPVTPPHVGKVPSQARAPQQRTAPRLVRQRSCT